MAEFHTLLCVPNWIGDGIMAMPAVHRFWDLDPDTDFDVLAKPGVAPLWGLHPAVREVHVLHPGLGGMRDAAERLRAHGYALAFVFPNSLRAALIPSWAGIGERVGFARSQGFFLLSRRVKLHPRRERQHQALEYMDLLGVGEEGGDAFDPPRLRLLEADRETARAWMPGGRWVGLLPGAARGPAKRWPPEHFRALAERLLARRDCRVALMGSSAEAALCEQVGHGLGPEILNLAGRTPIPLWAAALERCAAVVCNDSGGMHLASAVGVPVVALYGQTDPARTGPLGRAVLLQRSAVRSRDIARDSAAARNSLASIPPDEVYDATCRVLGEGRGRE